MAIGNINLNELDLNDAGNWPIAVKAIVAVVILALIVAGGWHFFWKDLQSQLARVEAQETQLRTQFETRQRRAANLDAYEALLADMREELSDRLRQLPSRGEIPQLLADVSQAGLGAGLDFELFRPGSIQQQEFYAQRPIQIEVRGNYHQFGRFISEVANMPRIVTLHDVNISRSGSGERLAMRATARTYWYLDDDEGGQ
ncbi:type IV pilus assembly protein PilO [Natronocella acetinitrilica]|jgi:type IV pilus assembly protein PilO|uniref:Type IV pilus assembly protein PilO n=1 Tax=Natronocella acetinitrilica TaxID=414046 RepID=A0AAE3KDI2_9GAMM|nr:type 4a pilus biogenesis protein PilO [Natronocella acetinitrilica]MCP1676879.1 type IV pilus assembly protein PilO [Natronocella acetinitrilica]